MAEPFATTEQPEEAKAEQAAPKERFEHAATPEIVSEVEAVPVGIKAATDEAPSAAPAEPTPEPESKPAASRRRKASAETAATPAPEWPVAWLRLVEPEPPAPDEDAVAAVLAAETADADGVAHAFGLAMAAALDPHAEEETPAPAEAVATEAGANADAETLAANDPVPDAPVRLPTARARRGAVEAAPAAVDDTRATESEAAAAEKPFNPRDYAPKKPRTDPVLEARAGEGGIAAMIYLLYLAGFLFVPAVVGVVMALNVRRGAPDWLASHYLFQVRTFWIGFVGCTIAAALLLSGALTLAGLVLGLALVVWLLARSAAGFIAVVKLRSYPRPHAWLL